MLIGHGGTSRFVREPLRKRRASIVDAMRRLSSCPPLRPLPRSSRRFRARRRSSAEIDRLWALRAEGSTRRTRSFRPDRSHDRRLSRGARRGDRIRSRCAGASCARSTSRASTRRTTSRRSGRSSTKGGRSPSRPSRSCGARPAVEARPGSREGDAGGARPVRQGECRRPSRRSSGPSVDWGKWALVFGKTAAVKQGAAAKIRDYAQAVILLDPAYDGGGGYRVLGRLHHQTPAVPFFTGWASRARSAEESPSRRRGRAAKPRGPPVSRRGDVGLRVGPPRRGARDAGEDPRRDAGPRLSRREPEDPGGGRRSS